MIIKKRLTLFWAIGCACILLITLFALFWWTSPIRQRADLLSESRKAWATSIEFFGKVVDENGNPVSGANVRFQATDLSKEGTSEYFTTSDQNGLFTLAGVKGKHLGVFVSKNDYHTLKSNRTAFEYAAGGGQYGIFTPNLNNPVLFFLRKKKESVRLIERELQFKLRLDGTPVGVNLTSSRTAPLDESEVTMVYSASDLNAKRGYDWRFRVTVPNGGLVSAVGEFLLEAPEVGYLPFDEIHMAATEDRWQSSAGRTYFLKLKNGNYAITKIYVETGGDRFVILEYYLNPTGSRDLEHDPKKRGF